MSLVWLAPAAVLVAGALALGVAVVRLVRRAEALRVSVARLGELRAPLGQLGDDLRAAGAALDELRHR